MVMTFGAAFLFSVYNGPSAAVVDELGPPQYARHAPGRLHVRPPRPRQRPRPLGGRARSPITSTPRSRRRCRRPSSPSRSPACSSWWSPAANGTSPRVSLTPHMSTPAPTTQDYYDRFAAGYEAERHHGYHRLIDELELELVRRFGSGTDVFEAGCGTGLLLARGGPRRALGRRPRSVARDAAAGARARPPRRPGLAHRRASAVGVVRSRLQHEGAGARAADRTARSPSWRGWCARADTCCSSSTTRCRCAIWPSAWAAPGRSPTTARPRTTSTPASTRCRARAATCRPSVELVAVRGVRVVTPSSQVFALSRRSAVSSAGPSAPPATRRCCATSGGFLILVAQQARQRGLGRCPSASSSRRAASSSPNDARRSAAVLLPPLGRLALSPPPADGSRFPAGGRAARAGDRRRQRRARPDAHQALRRVHRHRSDARARSRGAGRRPAAAPSFAAPICCATAICRPTHYDAIVCFSVLEHIRDADGAARGLARALAPGGTLVTGYPMVSPLMTRAFAVIGFDRIDDHHVSPPARIAAALARGAQARAACGVPARRRPCPRRSTSAPPGRHAADAPQGGGEPQLVRWILKRASQNG